MEKEKNILKVIEGIAREKGVEVIKEDNTYFIKGDKFKLYFSIDNLSENAIIWDRLEFPMIINYEEFNNQFDSKTKKLIYDIMKEVEELGVVILPF